MKPSAAALNWREIDLVLDELDLQGCLIRDVHQPLHDRFVLSLFKTGLKTGRRFDLLVCMSTRSPRLHALTERLSNPAKPFRFAAFLRAHIKGGRIESAAQCGRERIVRICVAKAGEKRILWLRLWGSAANAIVTDEEGIILDAFYRRPKRNEISGGRFSGEAPRVSREAEYSIRELPGEGSFNERLERLFREMESRGDAERARAERETELGIRESKVLANLEKLERRLSEYSNLERFRELGELLTSSLHRITKGDRWVRVSDFFHDDAPLDIELSPELSPSQNAGVYFERYKKARDGAGRVREEIANLRLTLSEIEKQRRILAEAAPSELLSRRGKRAGRPKKAARGGSPAETPGLSFDSGAFRILVGRSARENEELLRVAVRGNDWWFHARDWPGAYVFVKTPQGKSLPLETMLDAANLAIHFSKGKASGAGDVYYTQVKYLKRIKGAKKGLVIPTREKNVRVRLDEARIEGLKGERE
jgi:predicted ribosome quality control (RQC) complex YloA/Tae2 family protein